MSNGTQQIKEYNPESYKTNSENTPLRKRARLIMQEAMQYPQEGRKELIRELYRNTPYRLKQDEPVNLRMKIFYFEKETIKDDLLIVYCAVDSNNPNPETDTIITENKYGPKKEIKFAFEDRIEEYYYAVNERTGEGSNLLHFIWEKDFDPVIISIKKNSISDSLTTSSLYKQRKQPHYKSISIREGVRSKHLWKLATL
ncbi:MAG: hypothetical protein WC327_04480 [Candidatus Cloacimonadia bacterium]